MSKRIRVSVLAAVIISLLAGLGGGARTVTAASPKSSVVHLTYWNMWSGIWTGVVQKMVDAFNQTHSTIQVKMLSVPSSNAEQKLLTAVAAGNPPDVFTEWNPYVAAFAQKHAVLDLGQFMTGKYAGMKNNYFYPVAAKWGTYQGKLYAMPWTMNSLMLYYNKALMKQAGLNPNDPPKTIAQLDAQQAKMWKYGSKGQVTQIGFYANAFEPWVPTWNVPLLKNGKYDLTNANAVKLMSWMASYKRYPYSQVNAFISGVSGAGGGSTDPFELGKQGFYINGMWEIPTIQQYNPKMQYGVVPLPIPPGGNADVTMVNGNYNEILTGSKHPQQAFEFMAWLSGYDNEAWAAKAYPTGGWVPNSPKIAAKEDYQKFLNQNPLRKPFVSVMLNPKDGISPVTPAELLYEKTLTDSTTAVLEGQMSPTQALQHVEQVSNQELQATTAAGG